MANAELIEYAKNQLKAGSSANYIRTVLIKQGWGERDVDDALGIAQAEAGTPSRGAAPAAAAKPVKTNPETGKNKFLAIACILTGVFFLISAILLILTEMQLLALTFNVTTWITAIIELIAGIFWIIVAIKELRK
jgi:hypothetical protein